MTCKHASSGCDYPAGECSGSCMQQSTRESWGHVAELEGECKALRDEIISARAQRQAAHRYIETLLDERAELLEALKRIAETTANESGTGAPWVHWVDQARSAIAKAGGTA